VRPYALDENYRINHDGALSFTLEKRRRDKKTGEPTGNWSTEGYHSDLADVCRSWARKAVRESDAELPQALNEAHQRLREVLRDLESWDFQIVERNGRQRVLARDAAIQADE